MGDPRHATDEVLRRVGAATGKPVLVTADPSLSVLATVRPAGASSPAHLLRYNPTAQPNIDYLTCYQCGFLLRTAATDPSHRFEVGSTFHGRKQVEHLMREHGRQPGRLPVAKEMRDGLRDRMYDGLILQLRSVPVGLRVDAALLAEFPALAEQQRVLTLRQLRENLAALSPDIRRFAPDKVFKANAAMNAAYAAFWAREWSDPTLTSPYRAAGSEGQGEALAAILGRIPADAEHDRDLIQGWGDQLGLSGWFEFVMPRG